MTKDEKKEHSLEEQQRTRQEVSRLQNEITIMETVKLGKELEEKSKLRERQWQWQRHQRSTVRWLIKKT